MAGLTSFAAAFCAQRALRGRTMAADRVLLEPGAAVDIKEPTIVVYAVHGAAETVGRNLLEAGAATTLRLELFLPCEAKIVAAGMEWTLDTSASLSLAFALFWRQCEVALSADQGPWANLFRAFVMNIEKMRSGAELVALESGMKIAVRVVEMDVTTIDGPPIGLPPQGSWAALLDAMRGDGPEMMSLADLVDSVIAGDESLLDWQVDFAWAGQSQSTAPALGLAPIGDIDNLDAAADIEAPATPAPEPQA